MRFWFVCLSFLSAINAASVSTIAQESPSVKKDSFTVFIGEFEYALANIGRSGPNDQLQTIVTFIIERQPLEPKYLQMLEEHRGDFSGLLHNQSPNGRAAAILLWMNSQKAISDAEILMDVLEMSDWQMRQLQQILADFNLDASEDLEQLFKSRQIGEQFADPSLKKKYGQMDLLLERLKASEDKLDDIRLPLGSFILYDKFLGDGPLPIAFYLDMLRVSRIDSHNDWAIRSMLQTIASKPSVEQSDIDLIRKSRRHFMRLFFEQDDTTQTKGLLALLLVWINANSDEDDPFPMLAINSLSQHDLSVIMQNAPLLKVHECDEFRSIVSNRFVNGDDDTVEVVLDILEIQANKQELKMSTAIDLFGRFADRPTLGGEQLKRMMIILKDVQANEVGVTEQVAQGAD